MGGWVGGWSRIDYNANSVQLLLQLPTGTELGKNRRKKLLRSVGRSVGRVLRIDNKANSVQLQLQLPTGTELGNKPLPRFLILKAST